jgi:hypothetical protein
VGKADTSECLSSLNTFLSLADSLGIPITAEKTQYPTTMITIYGIAIDSIEMVARLSVNKVEHPWVKHENTKIDLANENPTNGDHLYA